MPAWVVPAAPAPGTVLEAHPMHYRVVDEQIRVEGRSHWDYNHVVRVVATSAGLSTAALIELEFDPSYQRLVLHHLRLNRGGQAIDKSDRQKVQLLQRETQLERRMYDGRVTFTVALDDVRVGDEVDFAYSIVGANPVFGGRFATLDYLSTHRGPAEVYQLRLLAPQDRTIQARIGPAQVQAVSREIGPERETVFRRVGAPRLNLDQGAPPHVLLDQMVQLSEFRDWADVAAWGQALFADTGGGARADALAAEIAATHASPEARVLAALAFVQTQVRYFGTEIGSSSHKPASADQVIQQRFGDCKDKVALLVALLRRLDVKATPVLVNSGFRAGLHRLSPSPLAFDHVIARIDLDGRSHYIDATRATQSGSLAARQAVDFGRGLALEAGTTGLASLPAAADSVRQTVEDTIRVSRFSEEPELEARITAHGIWAESLRESLATRGLEALQTQLASPYVKVYPRARSSGPMQVEDVAGEDAVRFVLRFRVGDFWRFPEERVLVADVVQWSLIDAVMVPRQESRRDPWGLAYPGIYRHDITLRFDEAVTSRPVQQPFQEGDGHFVLKGSFETQAREISYRGELRLLADEVLPGAWSAYSAKVLAAGQKLQASPSLPALSPARLEALRKELQGVDEAIKAHRLDLVTKAQVDAHVKALILSAQLGSGRLGGALEAQARLARGIQYDHLGRFGDARRDFDLSLQLNPESSALWNAIAVNALQMREFDRALDYTGRSLARNPRDSEARQTQGLVRYLKQDLPAARADFEALLDDPAAVRRGYPLVWLSMALRQAGDSPSRLADQHPADRVGSDWPRPLVNYAYGQTSAVDLIASARASNSPKEQLCEAYLYIAERLNAEGERQRAIEFWKKAVETGVIEFVEAGVARHRLAEFSGGR